MRNTLIILSFLMVISTKSICQCTVPTFITCTYTFTEVYAGTTVDVTWNADCPAALMRVSIIRYSPLPSLVLQDFFNLPNTGSFMFPINPAFVPGTYGFYVQDMGVNMWSYCSMFDLLGPLLPVELVSFDGKVMKDHIQLNWATASEQNNLGFEIEKSLDGRLWDMIDYVEGKGTTNEITEYQNRDFNPSIGLNYYRLKQIDFDGKFDYSQMISLLFEGMKKDIGEFYPNPSLSGMVNLDYHSFQQKEWELRFFDITGRLLSFQKVPLSLGDNLLTFDFSKFESGVYFARLGTNSDAISRKIIIDKRS